MSLKVFFPCMLSKQLRFNNLPKLINGVTVVFALFVLHIDWLITNELNIEGIYAFGASLLLLIKLLSPKRSALTRWLAVTANAALVSLMLFNLGTLLILLFGYGYQGRGVPIIWILASFISVWLLLHCAHAVIQVIKAEIRNAKN